MKVQVFWAPLNTCKPGLFDCFLPCGLLVLCPSVVSYPVVVGSLGQHPCTACSDPWMDSLVVITWIITTKAVKNKTPSNEHFKFLFLQWRKVKERQLLLAFATMLLGNWRLLDATWPWKLSGWALGCIRPCFRCISTRSQRWYDSQ